MTVARDSRAGWRWVGSSRAFVLVWGPIVAITAAHFSVGMDHHWLHDVLRRLYYIPIVLAAFAFGARGALASSLLVSLLYAPHAFTTMHGIRDPGGSVEKILEILLYNVIAYITGTLADRERRERVNQERIAKQLAESLDEVRTMEQQLVRAAKLRALGELTAGLAHEIKNPLASLRGAAEIISDEVRPDSPRWKMVEVQKREFERLTQLLERFLSFARPQASIVAESSVAELLEPVVSLLAAQAAKRGVRVDVEVSSPCAPVRCDKDQVTAVLLNVILNAIQAAAENGVVRVSTQVRTRGRRVFCTLDVEDDGVGVPVEMRERIFNPFVTTKEGGTGLGLSIAARIMDAHEGFIEALDGPSGGALFRLWFPVGPAPALANDGGVAA